MGRESKYACSCSIVISTHHHSGSRAMRSTLFRKEILKWLCEESYVCRRIDVAFYQFVEIQVYAALRITLKPLVPTFPCFSKIVVSLLEKVSKMQSLRDWIISNWVGEQQLIFHSFHLQFFQPKVDFGLKVMGGDIMSIPGLYRYIQVVIHMILHCIGWTWGWVLYCFHICGDKTVM